MTLTPQIVSLLDKVALYVGGVGLILLDHFVVGVNASSQLSSIGILMIGAAINAQPSIPVPPVVPTPVPAPAPPAAH